MDHPDFKVARELLSFSLLIWSIQAEGLYSYKIGLPDPLGEAEVPCHQALSSIPLISCLTGGLIQKQFKGHSTLQQHVYVTIHVTRK